MIPWTQVVLGDTGGIWDQTRMTLLLWTYWERLTIVAWSGRYYGDPFTVIIKVMYGNPLTYTIFNIVVDVVIPL